MELTKINTIDDVKAFFTHVVEIIGDEWHPDDDFSFYTDKKTKEPLFTPEEIALYNRLLAECFEVCEKADEDIYDLGWEIIEKSIE